MIRQEIDICNGRSFDQFVRVVLMSCCLLIKEEGGLFLRNGFRFTVLEATGNCVGLGGRSEGRFG